MGAKKTRRALIAAGSVVKPVPMAGLALFIRLVRKTPSFRAEMTAAAAVPLPAIRGPKGQRLVQQEKGGEAPVGAAPAHCAPKE